MGNMTCGLNGSIAKNMPLYLSSLLSEFLALAATIFKNHKTKQIVTTEANKKEQGA